MSTSSQPKQSATGSDLDNAEVAPLATGSTKPEEDTHFMPVFGSENLGLSESVMASGLAAISVKHGTDEHDHSGHSHAPPASHLKQFFKSRASLPAGGGIGISRLADRKRHSMPATLPECMDPSNIQGRHSFLSVIRPDMKTLPEYRDKTQRQVEGVVQDHSVFGRIQELAHDDSDEELDSNDSNQAGEDAAKVSREKLPAALLTQEEHDNVPDLPQIANQDKMPRAVASVPIARRASDNEASNEDAPPQISQSLTSSRMMLRCDSDPRLSLRTSTAEVKVDIHEHSSTCEHHEAHDEDQKDLEEIESSAFGIHAERTSSATKSRTADAPGKVLRRSGSADGGALDMDSDEEIELRVRDPTVESGLPEDKNKQRYY